MAYGGEVDATSVRRMGLELENGSAIEALPGSPNTVQGYSASLIILDEAGIIEDELYTVMRPSLAVTGGDLILASKAYQARGAFYREWTEGGDVWHREMVRADDSSECPRITPEFLAEERQHMMEHEYAREYLCRFDDPAAGSAFGPKSLFEANTADDLPPLWDKEGRYVPLNDPIHDMHELKQREAELLEQLGKSKASRREEMPGEEDFVWTWEDWQR